MSIAMLIIIIGVLLAVAGVAGVAGFAAGRGRLEPPPVSSQDRRIAAQADQIETLEEEIRRLRDQADFTEKLLSERSGGPEDSAGDGP